MDSAFERLLRSEHVSAPTRRLIDERMRAFQASPPRWFTADRFATLVSLVAVLPPDYPRPTAREVAQDIDRRLADGQGDGWRYAGVPTDGDTYNKGLDHLAGLDLHAMIHGIQAGTVTWSDVDARRFLEEVLVEVVECVYSHPEAQAAIGYAGFADATGWRMVGLGEREAWEP